MANDKVAIWNQTIKLGRPPANGELLIGNGEDFTLANITAGAGASVSNTAGGIQISATGSGGTVTGVTATDPLASSGGAAPDISLSGIVDVAHGGTGLATLTANNVLLGNGTSSVQFVAPGTNGNILTSNGTTWTSAPPSNVSWSLAMKTSDQNLATSSTAYQDVTGLSFSAAANTLYHCRSVIIWTSPASAGGCQIAVNGPASPTLLATLSSALNVTTYDTRILSSNSQAFVTTTGYTINFIIKTGSTAGTVIIRASQLTSNTLATTIYGGSILEYVKVS